jgi:predicted AAA+ superfamily ATPase
MKKEILKEIIRDFQTRKLPSIHPRKVSLPVNAGKIVSITGVRRSGKTCLMYDTIRQLSKEGINFDKIVYINFEDERLDFKTEELDLILQAYRELYPDTLLKKVYFFFDEVQNLPDWEKFVRRIADNVSQNIYITGSNAHLLSSDIATVLRGRSINYEVYPLSFMEYLTFNNTATDLYDPAVKAKIVRRFEEFLRYGGFPEIFGLSHEIREKTLQEYFNVMIYKDIVERFGITNLGVLKYFLKRVFESVTKPMSVNKIYNELKSQGYRIGKNMLYEFLDAAESVYLVLPLKKYAPSVLKQELSEKKSYCIDTGLLSALSYDSQHNFGKLLENLVFLELRKAGKKIAFIKNGKECDFVLLENNSPVTVIQVSYSLSDYDTKKRELISLIETCRTLGIHEGFILTYDEDDEIFEDGMKITVMPVYKYLIQQAEH